MTPKPREKQENWLLFKSDDEAARPADAPDILAEKPHSAATGRSIEAIGREQDRVWSSGQGEVTERDEEEAPAQDRRSMPLRSRRPKKAAMPGFIEPTLPTATETAPAGGGWLHEIKHDGYRLQAHLENGRVTLFSRQGLDWTERFARRRAGARRGAGQGRASSTARWWCRRRRASRASPCWSTR